jgi:predicted short-subunit dehydrogenase-like oxidoreductase (DUF2520 family)
LNSKEKALYHLSAVLASNLSVVLLEFAKSTSDAAGINAAEFFPKIIETTINNVYDSWKNDKILPLTGPFARGDSQAVMLHQKALKEAGLDNDIYKKLAEIAAKTAFDHGFIDQGQFEKMINSKSGEYK